MNKDQSSKVAEAELDLNNALVNADISNGYEEYLALFEHFYDENVEVASDSNPDPLVGKARVLPIIFNFLMPLHVMAEIGGLSVRLRYTPLFSDKREEQHADWSLDLVGATGRSVMVSWSSARRWKDARVIYERHSDHRQFGEALTMIERPEVCFLFSGGSVRRFCCHGYVIQSISSIYAGPGFKSRTCPDDRRSGKSDSRWFARRQRRRY